MIYLLTATGLTHGGISTVHIYTQTIHTGCIKIIKILYGKYGTVTKHSCIVAKLAYVFFIDLLV